MTTLANSIFTGPGVALTFVVTVLVLARWPGRRVRIVSVSLALGYFCSTVFVVPQAVAWLVLTRGFHAFAPGDLPPGRTVIVLLGGGTETVYGWDDSMLASPRSDGLERVVEAARVFRLTHAATIISSGGTLDPRSQRDGIAMRDALVRIGVPADRIVLEIESRTTHDEAVLIAPMLRTLGAEHVVLVTSDVHMKRSLGAFRAYGVEAIPAIAPSTVATDRLAKQIRPSPEGLERSSEVAHELIGIPYYVLNGWWRR